MENIYVCIFGGTTEARLLADFLSNMKIQADLYVATEYGQQFVDKIKNINVYQKRLEKDQMIDIFMRKNYNFVIDATHPFAKIVSENILYASNCCKLKYIRVIREYYESNKCNYFYNISEIINYLNFTEGNILLTTGSKNLEEFTKINNYKERVYPRVLPMEDSLKKALDLGYKNKNIICMQGPFSEELNIAIIKSINAKYLVTKESSYSGGFPEKVNACTKTNVNCIVLNKPLEEGKSLKEIYKYFENIKIKNYIEK